MTMYSVLHFDYEYSQVILNDSDLRIFIIYIMLIELLRKLHLLLINYILK